MYNIFRFSLFYLLIQATYLAMISKQALETSVILVQNDIKVQESKDSQITDAEEKCSFDQILNKIVQQASQTIKEFPFGDSATMDQIKKFAHKGISDVLKQEYKSLDAHLELLLTKACQKGKNSETWFINSLRRFLACSPDKKTALEENLLKEVLLDGVSTNGTSTHTQDYCSESCVYVAGWHISKSAMLGKNKASMEDTHLVFQVKKYLVAMVIDGHGGFLAATLLGKLLQSILETLLNHPKIIVPESQEDAKTFYTTLMFAIDAELLKLCDEKNDNSGATLALAIIDTEKELLTCVTVADAEVRIVQDGKLVQCTKVWKPSDPEEKARIEAVGYRVACGRIFFDDISEQINVSRSLGDSNMKSSKERKELPPTKWGLTAIPEVSVLSLKQGVKGLVVGCDGLFNAFGKRYLGEATSEKLINETLGKDDGARLLVEKVVQHGDGDNVTCLFLTRSQ